MKFGPDITVAKLREHLLVYPQDAPVLINTETHELLIQVSREWMDEQIETDRGIR